MALSQIRYEQLIRDTERKRLLARMKWFTEFYSKLSDEPPSMDEVVRSQLIEETAYLSVVSETVTHPILFRGFGEDLPNHRIGRPTCRPVADPKYMARLRQKLTNIRQEMFKGAVEEKRKMAEAKSKDKASVEMIPPEEIELYLKKGPMYPVHKKELAILYSGISHNGEGREGYLSLRNHKVPEKKYLSPMTSSHLYGWKVAERCEPAQKGHCRSAIIKASFYRRTGTMKPDSDKKRPPYPTSQTTVEIL
ncbi:hypothetical protein AAG570_001069 [Ranatra chinensis]|uniref:Sperm microtubule inner protein 1 C-terminal domain-containing protein n=1 Tax=Ranatra chinensis TaxID=642074 RepID=A0ABD0YAT8_9HEMI